MALTSNEITSMRDELELTLVDTAVISRQSGTSDGQGGSTSSWAAFGTALCRVSPLQAGMDEGARADRVSATSEYVITFAHGTDVTERDRVACLGVTYELTAVKAPRTWELSRRVRAKVIT